MITQQLIAKCKKKDQKAIKQLYEQIYSDLMGICVRYQKTSEDAEEAHHDSFIKVITQLKKIKPEVKFIAWAKRITINTNIDRLRKDKSKNYNNAINTSNSHVVYSSTNRINEKIDADYILSIISQLEHTQRQVFNLYAIDGYSHSEIAKMMKIAESSSRGLLFKARKEIQYRLKKRNRNCMTYKSQEA